MESVINKPLTMADIPIIKLDEESLKFLYSWAGKQLEKKGGQVLRPPFENFVVDVRVFDEKRSNWVRYCVMTKNCVGIGDTVTAEIAVWAEDSTRTGFTKGIDISIQTVDGGYEFTLNVDDEELGGNRGDGSEYYMRQSLQMVAKDVFRVILFFNYYEPELKEYEQRERKTVYNPKKKKSKKTVQGSTIVNLNKYIHDINSHVKRLPYRKCPYSFGVRGHYRHYESGKVIFIKPHRRNVDKPSKQAVYRIGGLNEQG